MFEGTYIDELWNSIDLLKIGGEFGRGKSETHLPHGFDKWRRAAHLQHVFTHLSHTGILARLDSLPDHFEARLKLAFWFPRNIVYCQFLYTTRLTQQSTQNGIIVAVPKTNSEEDTPHRCVVGSSSLLFIYCRCHEWLAQSHSRRRPIVHECIVHSDLSAEQFDRRLRLVRSEQSFSHIWNHIFSEVYSFVSYSSCIYHGTLRAAPNIRTFKRGFDNHVIADFAIWQNLIQAKLLYRNCLSTPKMCLTSDCSPSEVRRQMNREEVGRAALPVPPLVSLLDRTTPSHWDSCNAQYCRSMNDKISNRKQFSSFTNDRQDSFELKKLYQQAEVIRIILWNILQMPNFDSWRQ